MFDNKAWDEYRKKRLLIIEYAALFCGIGLLLFGGVSQFQFLVFGVGQSVPLMLLLGVVIPFFLGYVLLRTSRTYFKSQPGKPRNKAFDMLMGITLLILFFAIFILMEFIENNYLKTS